MVADDVLTYDRFSPFVRDRMTKLEDDKDYWQKSLLDYTSILESCLLTGASHIAVIEDDVVSLKDWYPRTRAALESIGNKEPYLYLRLFYSEEYLGWQSQDVPIYSLWVSGIFIIVMIISLIIRQFKFHKRLNRRTLLAICAVNYGIVVILFFSAGKVTMIPLDPLHRGIVRLKGACCGQGLVFPRHIVPSLTKWYLENDGGHADLRTEQFADYTGLTRWALVPSVLQHIGKETSHEPDLPEDIRYDMSLAGRVWNFNFDLINDNM